MHFHLVSHKFQKFSVIVIKQDATENKIVVEKRRGSFKYACKSGGATPRILNLGAL
jgi:hypothetical protein